MNSSFLMLLVAAGIFRYLALEAKRGFLSRLELLLPRNAMSEQLTVLFDQFPEQIPAFRRRVLPLSALQILLNTLSCICFVVALWWFPPAALSSWDLLFMRYGSLLVVPLAFLLDVWAFLRLLISTLTQREFEE